MRKSLFVGLVISAALAAGSFTVAAQPGPHGGWGGHHGGQFGMMSMHKLKLSDAQKASIKQIMKSRFGPDSKTQWEALRKQRTAFQALKPNDPNYQSSANALAQAEGAAASARVKQMAEVRAKIYAVLTPSQQAEMATMKAQRQARRQQWKQFQAEHPVKGAAQSGQ